MESHGIPNRISERNICELDLIRLWKHIFPRCDLDCSFEVQVVDPTMIRKIADANSKSQHL